MKNVEYKLSDRPKWWVPRLFKWLALATALISFLSWVLSAILYAQIKSYSDQETPFELSATILEETAALSFEALFSIAFLWLLAIATDKIDQLVWLNASDDDRAEIIQKRAKKNAKN